MCVCVSVPINNGYLISECHCPAIVTCGLTEIIVCLPIQKYVCVLSSLFCLPQEDILDCWIFN